MMNIGTSELENTIFRLTNFKRVFRRLNFVEYNLSQKIFQTNLISFRYILDQIKRSTKRLIENLKNYKSNSKQTPKMSSIPKCRTCRQEFYPFEKVFKLVNYFKLARFET